MVYNLMFDTTALPEGVNNGGLYKRLGVHGYAR